MRPRLALLGAFLWLPAASPACARELPPVIHGVAAVQANMFGAVFEVESATCQIRLNRSLVATATQGAAFEVYAPLLGDDGSEMLHVTRGSLILIDEARDRAERLAPGGRVAYRAAPAAPADQGTGLAGLPEALRFSAATQLEDAYTQWQQQESRQGFLMSDSIMTRQQEYLASLKIDIRDLNHALASFIRRLLFR